MPTPPRRRRPRSTAAAPKTKTAKPTATRSPRSGTGRARPTETASGARPTRPPARRSTGTASARRPDGRTPGTRRAALHTGPLARVAGKVLLPLLIVASVVVVLGYAVFPTRTWLDQRATIADRQDELAILDDDIAALSDRVRLLGTDAEIERIARVDHGLVKPGEEAYAVLPAAPEPVRMPAAWPFVTLAAQID